MNTATDTIMTDPYLVTCTYPSHPPHAYIIEAESEDIAGAIARRRYQMTAERELVLTNITAKVTAYADLPEIMFGGEQTE
jgi:hypothetical protein